MRLKVDAKFASHDLGMKNMLRLMNTLKDPRSVDVGLIDAEPEVVLRGMINEYGWEKGNIPARPWFSTVVDARSQDWMRLWTAEFWRIFKNPDSGKTAKHLQKYIAEIMQADIADSIEQGDWVPNAESTIAKKGFDWPLVETGELANSITYRLSRPKKRGTK